MTRNRSTTLQQLHLDALGDDERFDSYARVAAALTGAPVSLVSVLSEDRESVVGSAGWAIASLPLASSLATLVAEESRMVVASNAVADTRLATHPLVAGPPHIRFVAITPLVLDDGTFLGALSVADRAERTLSAQQIDGLQQIARCVVREIGFRKTRRTSTTEMTRVRELLDESETRFREFFEQTDDFVLSVDANGRLLHCNEALLMALGTTREAMSSVPLLRFVEPESRESFRNSIEQVFESGAPAGIETTLITTGGRSITVDGVLRPSLVDDRAVLARVIFRDVTDRKQFESDLANARDAALEAARLKTQFLTNVSHEIRTPMNAIVGMIDLLADSGLTAEQIDHVHYARASAEQLLTLVNNALSVSTMEAGHLTVANLDFDLLMTLRRVVEVLRIAALGKDLTLSLDYDENLPTIVRGNRTRVSQVVTNLLDNAVKFTESGSVSLRVFLQSQTETHRVIRFEVADTGIGIAEEERLLLFERFSQVDAGSTRRYAGVGMGLAAARSLVEMMGGLMDFESRAGIGSTFWFTLPFPKELGSDPASLAQLQLHGGRVLLVDHLAASRQIVQHYLERSWEMTVKTASDAAGVVSLLMRDAAAGTPVQAVIFDALPDATLEQLARTIHGNPAIAATPLIYLLGTDERANDQLLRSAGIAAALRKPVGQSELNDALTMAFAQRANAAPQTPANSATPRKALTDVPLARRNGIHVLLAEDNFLNRKLTLTQLGKLGLKTTAVANGKELLDTVGQERFDIILMDCQMPIIDGYDASLEIRRREKSGGPRHYIIAMTANAREGDREKCFAAGMDDYLAKPTRHEDLSAAIAAYFERTEAP